jgi:hypothetical protein
MAFSIQRIRILGGTSFRLYPSANPCVEHDGGTSVHVLYISTEELEAVASQATQFGASVEVLGPVLQSPEQKRERLALLGVNKQDSVWPSLQCTSCAWFDPTEDPPCGVKSWPPESVSSFILQDKPKSDFGSCPVPDWRDCQ